MPLFANANIIPGSLTVSNGVTATTGNITATNGNVVAGTGVTSTTGDIVATAGDLRINGTGKGIRIKEGGVNARMGIANMADGTATVSTTLVGADSRIFLTTNEEGGGTEGFVRVSARTPGTSFTITSSEATDTGNVAWLMIDPA